MRDFSPFNYAQAIGAGTQNALAKMQVMQAGQQIKNAPQDRNYLMQQRERQSDSQDLDMKIKQYNVLKIGADQVLGSGGAGYDMFRQSMEDLGISNPGELPPSYDEALIKGLSGYAEQNIKKITKNLPGGMAQDVIYQGNNAVETGKPYNRWTPAQRGAGSQGAGKDRGLKASDENAIARQAGNLFGGMYDPVSGRFSGLKGENAQQKVQAIIERATNLFSEGRLTRAGAVSKAAREAGVEIEVLTDKPKPQKSPKTVKDFLEEKYGPR
ncbi:MAG: hypothetical protein L3J21_09925 [Devosiaceae bacterium]|nr:hypothetical protein [Devosiaceae bacterium]